MWGLNIMLTAEDIIKERKRWDHTGHQSECNNAEVQKIKAEYAKWIRARLMRGEIIDEALRKWLDGEISVARIELIVGMVLTALIKGQVFIWAIMYIAYRGRIKCLQKKAWDRNIKDYGGYLQ